MRRVVDTSAWIEWLLKTPVGQALSPQLPADEDWLAPTIVQFELAKWSSRELDEAKANEILAFSRTCVVVPPDTSIALLAADLSAQHDLSVADAIVYATAVAHDADLLTCDSHFEGLPNVTFVNNRR